jgi:hypothetical protein
MKQHTPMVNPNNFFKYPLMHNQNFHPIKKMLLITIIELEVVASLIMKKMEKHLNLC